MLAVVTAACDLDLDGPICDLDNDGPFTAFAPFRVYTNILSFKRTDSLAFIHTLPLCHPDGGGGSGLRWGGIGVNGGRAGLGCCCCRVGYQPRHLQPVLHQLVLENHPPLPR